MTEPVIHRYGADPAQFGELSLPDGRPLGTVVVLHGGFWGARYDLSLGRPLAADLAARGYAAWNLEYRRSGNGGGWPATFEDVAAGIDLLGSLPVDVPTRYSDVDACDVLLVPGGGGVRPRLLFEDFREVPVARDTVLVTYVSRSVAGPGWKPPALRSSLWVRRDARWQLLFHQGTRLATDSEA